MLENIQEIIIDILYCIGLILALVAIVMSFVLLRTINADKSIQQDDHDYSDDYTDPTVILGGTCNDDIEKEKKIDERLCMSVLWGDEKFN